MNFFKPTNERRIAPIIGYAFAGGLIGAAVGAACGATVGVTGSAVNHENYDLQTVAVQMNAAGEGLLGGILGFLAGAVKGLEREGFLTIGIEGTSDECFRFLISGVFTFILATGFPAASGAVGHQMLQDKVPVTNDVNITALHAFEGGLLLDVAIIISGVIITCLNVFSCIHWNDSENPSNTRSSKV